MAADWAEFPRPSNVDAQRWTGDFRSLRLRLYLGMILLDCVVLAASFLLANVARFGRPFESYGLNSLALVLPIYLAISFNNGAYSIRSLADPRRSVAMAVQSLLFSFAVIT